MAYKSEARSVAEKIVDDFLSWYRSADKDAGWHGDSMIGRLVDFKGDLPSSSGFYAVDSMEYEMRFVRHITKDQRAAIEIFGRMPKVNAVAVMLDRAVRGKTLAHEDPYTKKPVTVSYPDAILAHEMDMTVNLFKMAIRDGYQWIAQAVEQREAA